MATKRPLKKDLEKIVVFYDFNGKDVDDESLCFASCEVRNDSKLGKIHVFKVMFDPTGVLYNANSPIMKGSNRERFKLKRVTEECFLLYVKYLRTKNHTAWEAANRKAIQNV